MFIYNDEDVIRISSLNTTKDHNLLLACEVKENVSCISVYDLSKLNFNMITIFKPKRKIVSSIYSHFTYASFSADGNYIASLGYLKNKSSSCLQGVIWDIQIFQQFKVDNYKVNILVNILSPNAFSIYPQE
jgi:hypothetical protein